MIAAERIAEVLGGPKILGRRVRSLHDLERTISDGLPKRALRHTAERIYSTSGDVRGIIYRVVPEATFKRRVRLSPAESARTERLARVIAAAEYVWSDQTAAREWLTKPHPELNGRSPLECALSELGARQVEEILEKLFYGIPA
jgi:putative toxin-antitoxin system antitoxin component (TIGR02293 family)